MQKSLFVGVILAAVLALSSCSMYRPQIQQGNIITPKMVNSIKPNMTKAQVKYILGSPDVNDPWSSDTWYYVYTNKEQGQPKVANQLVLRFTNGKLTHMTGNYPSPQPLRYKTYHTK